MNISVSLLAENGIFVGVAFAVLIFVAVLSTSLFLRVANLFLRFKLLGSATDVRSAFVRKVWVWTFVFVIVMGLLLCAGGVFATWRGLHFGELARSGLSRVQAKDWLGLSFVALKALGVVLLAFVAARILVTVLHYVSDRLQRTEALTGHRDHLLALLEQLRMALSTTLLFGTLLLCAELFGIPAIGQQGLRVIAYIGIALYVGRFAVGAAHLLIDVLFQVSEALGRLENPLRYLGRFRHLGALTKKAADYFIYVGIATWTLEQITPGTWAAQSGRIALRIIAIFYLSRVLIEVCVVFMKEFFLADSKLSAAEFQQRQTLIPVAAGLLRYGIYFTAVVMILREAGLDPTPLLAGAGILGVAVGLGAQAFVGDVVAGFFILFESLFLIGDFIEIGEIKGKVEEINVRVTKIRDEAGILHAVPNGEVRKVASHSKAFVNVVIDIPLPYGEDMRKVFAVLTEKVSTVRESHSEIIGATEIGIEDLRDASILVRTVTMVKPGLDKELGDVLRLAFFDALVAAGISSPFARHMILPAAQASSPRAPGDPALTVAATPKTDIQRLKSYHLYLAFDINGNGYLDRADLDAFGQRLLQSQRRTKGSPLHDELSRKLEAYWQAMLGSFDRDHDGRVSREEFLQFCSSLGQELSGSAGEAVQALSDMLFTICDHNGSNTLSEAEFVQFARAYGSSAQVAAAGFRLLDADRNGAISKEEWRHFMRDVFLSRKLNDAAAVVFGPDSRETV